MEKTLQSNKTLRGGSKSLLLKELWAGTLHCSWHFMPNDRCRYLHCFPHFLGMVDSILCKSCHINSTKPTWVLSCCWFYSTPSPKRETETGRETIKKKSLDLGFYSLTIMLSFIKVLDSLHKTKYAQIHSLDWFYDFELSLGIRVPLDSNWCYLYSNWCYAISDVTVRLLYNGGYSFRKV